MLAEMISTRGFVIPEHLGKPVSSPWSYFQAYFKFNICAKGPICNKPALMQVMIWSTSVNKLFTESMTVQFTAASMEYSNSLCDGWVITSHSLMSA